MTGGTIRNIAILGITAVVMTGCMRDPKLATTTMQPKTPVVKTMTNFSQAKSCMDQLFLEGGRQEIKITSDKIEDATGTVKVSTLDMVINAISEMSKRSNAFTYVHVEGTGSSVAKIQDKFAPLEKQGILPSIYIRGSISQADNNVQRDGAAGSLAVPWASLSLSKEQNIDTISIDLQIVDTGTRVVQSGMTTSNTITVVSSEDSESARGLIHNGAFGGALSVSLNASQREGRGQAVRTLLEYSLVELLGKYTHVPYHRCLELPSTDPTSVQSAQGYFDQLSPESRTKAVQMALTTLSEYRGPADGVMSEAFQGAVSAAKLKRGLVADGRIDFQLFNALYNENVLPSQIVATEPPNPAQAPPPPAGPTPASGRDPFGLTLALAKPTLARGDTVTIRVSVTSPADIYCYYEYRENGQVRVTRVFPNRFQPDNHLVPGRSFLVPRPQDPFQIVITDGQPETLGCVATTVVYSGANRLPVVEQTDLEPLKAEWGGVGYPLYKHQEVDSTRTSAKKITFQASN